MKTLEGKLVAKDMKVGIVAARFNEFIVSKLIGGAVDGLTRHDVPEDNITLAWVPGAFEIPVAAKKMAESGNYDAVIHVQPYHMDENKTPTNNADMKTNLIVN